MFMHSYWQVCSVLYTLCLLTFSGYSDWSFIRAFSSVVRQMPGYTSQRGGTVRTLPNWWNVLFYVLFVSIVFSVLFVCKCVLYYYNRQLNISYQMRIWLEALITFVVLMNFQAVCCSWIDNSRNIGFIMSLCSTLFIAEHQKLAFSSGQSIGSNRTRCAHISWVVC